MILTGLTPRNLVGAWSNLSVRAAQSNADHDQSSRQKVNMWNPARVCAYYSLLWRKYIAINETRDADPWTANEVILVSLKAFE